MKKTLLTLSLMMALASGNAQQNLLKEDFNVMPPNVVLPAGWQEYNLSSPMGSDKWGPGQYTVFSSQDNTPYYVGVGFNAAGTNGTASDWLFSPAVSIQNGDVISFYTRTVNNPSGNVYPDRLQMRIAQGATPAVPVGATGVGDFTTLAVDVNPNYTNTGYPKVWTKYTYTVTGIPAVTPCRIGFRYFVTGSGGPTNGDYIGLDTFSIDRPTAGTQDFFMNNFSIAPNPANAFFNLTAKNGESIQNVKVFDINGRMVNEMTVSQSSEVQVNISDLNTGVYFVKVQSESGIGTSKIVKR